MKHHNIVLSFCMFLLMAGSTQAETKGIFSMIFGEEEAAFPENSQEEVQRYWDDCFDCPSQRLKVKKLRACNANIEKLRVKKECVKRLKAKKIKAEEIRTNTLCVKDASAEHLGANHIGVRNLDACNICADQLSSNYVCVNGNVEHCTRYKAHISLSTQTTYTLGNIIPFDLIVDDPNGNVNLVPYPRYIAPKTGYYEVTLGVGLEAINPGSGAMPGIPVLRPEILVNGLGYLKNVAAFLSFGGPLQNTILSGIIHLNAGDEVYALLNILVQSPFVGITKYLGNVELEAIDPASVPFTETFMTIHYKSSDCPVTCPCPLPSFCDIPEVHCPHIDVDCHEHECDDHHHGHHHGHHHDHHEHHEHHDEFDWD